MMARMPIQIIYYLNIDKMKRPLKFLMLEALLVVIAVSVEVIPDNRQSMDFDNRSYRCASTPRISSGGDAISQTHSGCAFFMTYKEKELIIFS